MESTEFLKKFGQELRAQRLKQGLSITKFADLADTDPAFVSRVERGLKDIKLSTAMKFLSVLGCPEPKFFE